MDRIKTKIHQLIEFGESETMDFKQSVNDAAKIAKTIAAFANGKGGVLLIGVKDNGNISGVNTEEEWYMLDMAAKMYCRPTVELRKREWVIEGKGVLECIVDQGKQGPYYALGDDQKWWVYQRVNDKTLLAGHIGVEVMKRASSTHGSLIEYNDAERSLFAYLSTEGEITLKGFQKLARINRWKASRILINLISAGVVVYNRSEKEEYFTLN